jgi:hypothetical protein
MTCTDTTGGTYQPWSTVLASGFTCACQNHRFSNTSAVSARYFKIGYGFSHVSDMILANHTIYHHISHHISTAIRSLQFFDRVEEAKIMGKRPLGVVTGRDIAIAIRQLICNGCLSLIKESPLGKIRGAVRAEFRQTAR